MRTIEALRNSLEGKIYVNFRTEEVFQRFLEDAETEGYLAGDREPTEAGMRCDIKAILYDKRICNCGAMSHMAYGAGGSNIHRIDYEKYVNGDDDYEVLRL